jgi:hypothetical protein
MDWIQRSIRQLPNDASDDAKEWKKRKDCDAL